MANESDVICAAPPPSPPPLGMNSFMEGLAQMQLRFPPPPPRPADVQHRECAHAVRDLFNATSAAQDRPFSEYEKGMGYEGFLGDFLSQIHRTAFDVLETCLQSANVVGGQNDLMPLE